MKGIRIRNGSGLLQIDSTYQNVALIRVQTLSGSGSVTIDTAAGQTLATRPSKPCVVYATPGSNGGCRWNIRVGWGEKDQSFSVTCYVFGPPPELGSGGKGVRIRREDGRVAFDSRLRYMNVYDIVSYSQGSYTPSNKTLAVVCSGYNYSVVISIEPGWESMDPNEKVTWVSEVEYTAVSTNGNGISITNGSHATGYRTLANQVPGYTEGVDGKGSPIILVDVTGF